mmetsp:Transcript_760/g.2740  ORF Transcript_760/g.2740 Transcript_760/m.2740 type:complete len:548 (-) Transcript_760:197-1840(-)
MAGIVTPLQVKMTFESDIRRLKLIAESDAAKFDELLGKASCLYSLPRDKLVLKYLDVEDDLVTLSCGDDIEVAKEASKEPTFLRVSVAIKEKKEKGKEKMAPVATASDRAVPMSESEAIAFLATLDGITPELTTAVLAALAEKPELVSRAMLPESVRKVLHSMGTSEAGRLRPSIRRVFGLFVSPPAPAGNPEENTKKNGCRGFFGAGHHFHGPQHRHPHNHRKGFPWMMRRHLHGNFAPPEQQQQQQQQTEAEQPVPPTDLPTELPEEFMSALLATHPHLHEAIVATFADRVAGAPFLPNPVRAALKPVPEPERRNLRLRCREIFQCSEDREMPPWLKHKLASCKGGGKWAKFAMMQKQQQEQEENEGGFALAKPFKKKMLARFVATSVPDGSVVAPGAPLDVRFTVRNDHPGGLKWPSSNEGDGVKLIHVSGGEDDPLHVEPVVVPLHLEPGESGEVSLTLTAPSLPGFYEAYYRLTTSQFKFGQRLGLKIMVVANNDSGAPAAVETLQTPGPEPEIADLVAPLDTTTVTNWLKPAKDDDGFILA